MQQLKIDNKSMYDIVNKWGFPSDLSEFEPTYKCDASQYDIDKFKAEIISLSKSSVKKRKTEDSEKKFSEYLNIISKNESIFDKNLYLLHIARLLRDDYAAQYNSDNVDDENCNRVFTSEEYRDMAKKALLIRSAKKILGNLDIANVRIRKDDNGDETFEVFSSVEFVANDKKDFNEEREKVKKQVEQIDKKIGLERILKFFEPEEFFNQDFLDVCRYENLSYLFKTKVEEQRDSRNKTSKIAEIIRNYAGYIDIDKLLVLANSRYYKKFEYDIETRPYEEVEKLRDFTENVRSILLKKGTKVKPYSGSKDISFKELEKEIKSIFSHFINGRYYQEYEKNDLLKDIVSGKTSLLAFSRNDFLNLRLSQREISEMIFRNPTSIEFLIENNLEKTEEVKGKIELQKDITPDQLLSSLNSGVLDYADIMRLYYDKKISIETIKKLKEKFEEEKKSEESEKLTKLVSSKTLVKMLLSKDNQKAEAYIKLYKALIIDGKSLEEKKNIANEILDYSLDLLEEEKMYELYHKGLIPVDSLIDIIGEQNSAFKELFDSGEIKPIDARRLYLDGIVTEESFINLLDSKDLGNRITLIFSTFPDTNDQKQIDIRMKLLKTILPVTRRANEKKSKRNNKKKDNKENENNEDDDNNGSKGENNKNISDPCLRFNFISMLDEEYEYNYLKDGTGIFYLPNKEKYIVEKLFKEQIENLEYIEDLEDIASYGVATYILDKEAFERYKDIIIDRKNNCIRPKVLPRLNSENPAIMKFIHTGWGNALEKYFEVDSPAKYSDEQRAIIHELGKQIDEQTRRKKKTTDDESGSKKEDNRRSEDGDIDFD